MNTISGDTRTIKQKLTERNVATLFFKVFGAGLNQTLKESAPGKLNGYINLNGKKLGYYYK